jgi:hypothetical protein
MANFIMKPFTNDRQGVNEAVSEVTNILHEAGKHSLRYARVTAPRKRKRKLWYDSNCKDLKTNFLNARRSYLSNPFDPTARTKYFKNKKVYKKTLKYKERKYEKDLLLKLEKLQNDDPKAHWQLVNNLIGKNDCVENDIGLNQWREHFDTLNNPPTDDLPFHKNIEDIVKNINSHKNDETHLGDDTISATELRNAISRLKSNKSAGPDMVRNEMLICCAKRYTDHLLRLFNLILETGEFPDNWRLSYLTPIFKKGDINDPNDYRGIALSSCFSKLFLSIINERLSNYMEKNGLIDPAQHGFRKQHSTIDNIFVLNTLIRKAKSEKKNLYVCFVDFSKAFDRVWRTGLLYKLSNLGINDSIYSLIKSLYEDINYVIKTPNGVSSTLGSSAGVKQGCVCSPLLFNIYINDFREYLNSTPCNPPTLADCEISHLLFADDLVLLSNSDKGLQRSIRELECFCQDWKLDINMSKTKIIIFNSKWSSAKTKFRFIYKHHSIEITDQYTYLGVVFTCNGCFKLAQIAQRKKALRAWYKIRSGMQSLDFSPASIMSKLYEVIVKPIAIYGSEIWGMQILKSNKTDLFRNWTREKVNDMTIKVAKSILGVPRKTSNIASLAETGLYPSSIDVLCNSVKYVLRSSAITNNGTHQRLLGLAVTASKRIQMQSCLHTDVMSMLSTAGMQVPSQQCITPAQIKKYADNFACRMKTVFTGIFRGEVHTSSKLNVLKRVKNDISASNYLSHIRNVKHRRAMTMLRTSSHPLNIEVGRYSGTPSQMRFCNYCTDEIEDELHFLAFCPKYKELRLQLLSRLGDKYDVIVGKEDTVILQYFLDPLPDQASLFGKYIYECLECR